MKINNNKIKSLFLLSLVGSDVGQQTSENQTEIVNVNQIPQMSANLTKRQNNPDKTLVFGGYPITLGVDTDSGHFTKNCAAGLVLVNTNNTECNYSDGNDYGGFLTSSSCMPYEWEMGTISLNVYSLDGLSILGNFMSASYASYGHGDENNYYINNDYVYVSGNLTNLELTPYVVGGSNDEQVQLYPVTGLGSASIGSRVCAYGVGSGYNCGKLAEVNVNLTVPNPWYLFKDTNEGRLVNTLTFQGLAKVDLGTSGFYFKEDVGGSVYVESKIGDRTIAQVLGYITYFDNNDPNHKFFYYTLLDNALKQISNDKGCSYELMTYNETHATEHKEFQAQVEIPPKK